MSQCNYWYLIIFNELKSSSLVKGDLIYISRPILNFHATVNNRFFFGQSPGCNRYIVISSGINTGLFRSLIIQSMLITFTKITFPIIFMLLTWLNLLVAANSHDCPVWSGAGGSILSLQMKTRSSSLFKDMPLVNLFCPLLRWLINLVKGKYLTAFTTRQIFPDVFTSSAVKNWV